MESAGISALSYVHFDTQYIRIVPGLLKVTCLLLVFIDFLVVEFSAFGDGASQFFKFLSIVELIFTGVLLLLYLFYVPYVYTGFPWLQMEFFSSVASAALFALASFLLIFKGIGILMFAACIGFLVMFAYGYDALLKYRTYTSTPQSVIA